MAKSNPVEGLLNNLYQCFSNFFFGDPKSLKTTICKHDGDLSKFD